MQKIMAVLSGIIFGLGLSISQMIDRQRVLGFLDAAGAWDPTLMFVLGGAVGITVITFRFILPRAKPRSNWYTALSSNVLRVHLEEKLREFAESCPRSKKSTTPVTN